MPIRVRPQGPGRLRIVGAEAGSCEADALSAWLRSRSEVRAFDLRDKTGVVVVAYEDRPGLSGRFLRALHEEIARMERREGEVVPFSVKPVHSVSGRVRLQIRGASSDELPKLAAYAEVLMGVEQALASAPSGTLLLHYDPSASTEDQLVALLGESTPDDWPSEAPRGMQLRWGGAATDSLVLVAALSGALPTPVVVAGVIVCMARPFQRSVHALVRGKITIDLLDVVATGVALATGLPGTAAFIIWMVGVGDLMLDVSAASARAALASVMRQQEHDAFRLLPSGGVERVRVERLEVGDRFLAGTGHSVATDGVVVGGTAAVDESSLTGESRYVDKSAGATVYASTLVAEGELVVEVVRPGKASEAAKILSVLGTAGSKPLTLQDDALRFAGSLVAPTFGVAAAAGYLASDINRATCVLITDFGTGFRIAVPTSALTSLTLAAREGVLVKGAQYLERLSKTDVVVFDKTGTLTCGVPEVVEVIVAEGFTAPEVVLLAASAESRHDHPVAKALKAYAEKLGRRLLETELGGEDYFLGRGLET
ncbi:MAG: HAD-IC family P-type ATPase, partial [Polyangiales bacterium]